MRLNGTMPIPASTRRMLRAARYARILLVLLAALGFGLAGGPGAHGMAAAHTLVSMVICSDEGPATILMDVGGGPAEPAGDCGKCTSCLSHHLAAVTPPGLAVGREFARRKASTRPAPRLRRGRSDRHFQATGPPAEKDQSDFPNLSCKTRRAAGDVAARLTIVNTGHFGTWQGSGRSAKEACR